MYPALNMDESVLREGLKIMEDAIRHVEEQGHTEGDVAAYPCGNASFYLAILAPEAGVLQPSAERFEFDPKYSSLTPI